MVYNLRTYPRWGIYGKQRGGFVLLKRESWNAELWGIFLRRLGVEEFETERRDGWDTLLWDLQRKVLVLGNDMRSAYDVPKTPLYHILDSKVGILMLFHWT